MCAVFVFLSLSLSFIRPKPSRLFLHPSLLPQHYSKRMCVVSLWPSLSQQMNSSSPVPPWQRKPPPPPPRLSPLSPAQLTAAGTFDLLMSALRFFLFPLFLALSRSFSLTNTVSSTMLATSASFTQR